MSAFSLEYSEHQAPPGYIVVVPRICTNCKQTKYPLALAIDDLCCDCRRIFNTKDGQIWECWVCGRARLWGFGRPEETKFRPLLACESCGVPTEHKFLKVVRG